MTAAAIFSARTPVRIAIPHSTIKTGQNRQYDPTSNVTMSSLSNRSKPPAATKSTPQNTRDVFMVIPANVLYSHTIIVLAGYTLPSEILPSSDLPEFVRKAPVAKAAQIGEIGNPAIAVRRMCRAGKAVLRHPGRQRAISSE
jgi:hypothetical protein